jgi:hypothetical protein
VSANGAAQPAPLADTVSCSHVWRRPVHEAWHRRDAQPVGASPALASPRQIEYICDLYVGTSLSSQRIRNASFGFLPAVITASRRFRLRVGATLHSHPAVRVAMRMNQKLGAASWTFAPAFSSVQYEDHT